MEAVGQLAGGVAHDFNNLLTAILGYSQLAASMVAPGSDLLSHLQEIQKAAGRAGELTQQLLAFSRRQIIEQRLVNLNDLIMNTHVMLRRLIGENVELVSIADPNLVIVAVYPGQISQVLVNMAINARDAMPGGGKLTIETVSVSIPSESDPHAPEMEPGEYVMLSVTDNGEGMTEHVKARIFEPFFTTKQQGKGTGLGLSTCYGIVKQNGGHISVCSEPGRGCTFRIYLPAATADDLGSRLDVGDLPAGNERVLLVEDEETVRGMAARVLREQGYTVFEASNDGEAMTIAGGFGDAGIDLLFTDIVMPQNGWEGAGGPSHAEPERRQGALHVGLHQTPQWLLIADSCRAATS